MAILAAHDLTKHYHIGRRKISAVNDISLYVEPNQFVAIEGPSGSGKTTLLGLLSGLDQPSSGQVFIDGQCITGLSENQLSVVRNRQIGFIFQSFHLVPTLTALENVMFPAEIAHLPSPRKTALGLLERVGLAQRHDHYPHQMSGGERQRVAICRALINRPALVFADEPTGNLDTQAGLAVMTLLRRMQKEYGTTLILVTHNREISQQAGRCLVLQDGRVVDERLSAHAA